MTTCRPAAGTTLFYWVMMCPASPTRCAISWLARNRRPPAEAAQRAGGPARPGGQMIVSGIVAPAALRVTMLSVVSDSTSG
jgi:hypothetical protein